VETEATRGEPERLDERTAEEPASPATAGDADIAALNAKLLDATARAEDNHAKLLYALADFENFRKRSDRVLAERLSSGKRTTLAKFLPVLDNLERALAVERDSDGLRDGLIATQRGFETLLAGEGVTRLAVVGERFDPRTAEAIGTRETNEADEDVVLDEVQPGYAIGDEILRPARVIVAKHPDVTP
jgi:molecular chaperone GrpE